MYALIAPFPPRGKLDAVVELQDDEEVVAEGEDPWEEEGVQEAEIGVSRFTHTSAVADGFSHHNPSPLIPGGLCVISVIRDCGLPSFAVADSTSWEFRREPGCALQQKWRRWW